MSYRWQRTLDGYTLSHSEKIDFIRKVVKVGRYYKQCKKRGCSNPVVNKKSRVYCPEHYKELLGKTSPFSEPLLLKLILNLD